MRCPCLSSKIPRGTAHGAGHPEEHQVISGGHHEKLQVTTTYSGTIPSKDAPSQDNKYNDPVNVSSLWELDSSPKAITKHGQESDCDEFHFVPI